VRPFDYIISLCSFAYTLGATHLLFAATRMIRNRRILVFSWPHGLWMLAALVIAVLNWFSLWDFHHLDPLPLGVIVPGLVVVGIQYFVCALVSPDFEGDEGYDMHAFHAREGRTYMGAVLVLFMVSLIVNFAASAVEGVTSWANANLPILATIPFVVLPLVVRMRWVQVLSPLILIASTATFTALYYPVLK
jgi:hypothetical protein